MGRVGVEQFGRRGGDRDRAPVVELAPPHGRQPHQQRRGDTGGLCEGGVAGQFPGDLVQRLGAEVVLEKPLDLPVTVLVVVPPAAVAVGFDQVAEVARATGLRPPRHQLPLFAGPGVAGSVDQGGEPLVDADGVGQAQAVRDAEDPVVPVAEFLDVQAVLGGEHGRAGGRQDVVHGCGAEGDERLEAVDDTPEVELTQPHPAGAEAGKGQSGDLVCREDLVFPQHPDDPLVAGGKPPRQHSLVLGGVRDTGGGPGGLVAAQGALAGGVSDHGGHLRVGRAKPPRREVRRGVVDRRKGRNRGAVSRCGGGRRYAGARRPRSGS